MSRTGKVAVVTGAGQSLGRGLALALGDAGFRLALLGRTLSKLQATAAQGAGECLSVACDLSDPDQVRSAFARVEQGFGRIDVLINNAASYEAFPFDKASDDQIVNVVTQTMVAPMLCTREAIIAMRKMGGGDIVNISTQSVRTPQPTMIVYSAAKGGLEIFARGLRNEYRGDNIRILTAQIGVVADSTFDSADPDGEQRYLEGLQKAGLEKAFVFPGSKPADIAASIVHAITLPRNTVIEDLVIRGFEGPATAIG